MTGTDCAVPSIISAPLLDGLSADAPSACVAVPVKLALIALVNVLVPAIVCEIAVIRPATVPLAAGITALVPVEEVSVPMEFAVVYPRLVFAAAIVIEPVPFVIVTF